MQAVSLGSVLAWDWVRGVQWVLLEFEAVRLGSWVALHEFLWILEAGG